MKKFLSIIIATFLLSNISNVIAETDYFANISPVTGSEMVTQYQELSIDEYTAILRNPSNFINNFYTTSGKVIGPVLEDTEDNDSVWVQFCVALEDSPDLIVNIAYYREFKSDRILSGDFVTVSGPFLKLYPYYQDGQEIQVPLIYADEIGYIIDT